MTGRRSSRRKDSFGDNLPEGGRTGPCPRAHQVFRELLTYMMADPGTIERALALILISRNIERIADHATNIAEDVVIMVEAKDVRCHHA